MAAEKREEFIWRLEQAVRAYNKCFQTYLKIISDKKEVTIMNFSSETRQTNNWNS